MAKAYRKGTTKRDKRGRSTTELVTRWRSHDPHSTATEIARGLNSVGFPITRQRVSQILAAEGLGSRPAPRPVSVPASIRRAS